MSLNSVNTNVGAMMALQALASINSQLLETQQRISTGLRVRGPKDDASTWAIAQNQRAEVMGLDAVTGSLQRGQAIVDVAISGGESISDLLMQMKTEMLAAMEPGISASDKAAHSDQYVSLRKQIDTIATTSEFNGVGLISGGGGTGDRVRALANTRATSTIDVDHVDLSTTGALLSGLPADLTGTIVQTDLDTIKSSMSGVTAALGRLGSGSKALDIHLDFVGKQQDVLEASIGRLVDADLAKESARLQALQVRQQLAVMALGIANQAPSMLLQLFQRR